MVKATRGVVVNTGATTVVRFSGASVKQLRRSSRLTGHNHTAYNSISPTSPLPTRSFRPICEIPRATIMADSMEGVVVDAEQPKTENVEHKAIAGKLPTPKPGVKHALHLQVPLCQLHDIMACPQDVSQSHDRHRPGVLQVPLPAG